MSDASKPSPGFYSYEHLIATLGQPETSDDGLAWACSCAAIARPGSSEYLAQLCDDHRERLA